MKKIILVILFITGCYILKIGFQNIVVMCGQYLSSSKIFHRSLNIDIEAELKRLNAEIEKLWQENKRLRELLDLKTSYLDSIPAEIVFRLKEELSDQIIINAGRNKNVKPNSAVVSKYGLVGMVDEVDFQFSTVLPIYDPRFQISVRISSTREVALLKGQGKDRNLLLAYLDLDTQAKSGDLVFTSGEGILPKGIFVGEIKSISVHPSQVYKIAKVKPVVEINKVEEVIVVCKQIKW
ncbi:MAG TPA: rod shape-determining protein MreC [Candidatus Omnitrophica bacterium]|nr:rod shape-determining protein MreC [Candidatus Omnitrophota bacterium]